MRALVVAAVLAGCSFEHGAASTVDDAASPDAVDAEIPATCVDGWCLRKAIKIHGSEVVGTHSDFMLLVRIISDAQLAASALGPDIRFIASDGTPLPYERERYVPSTGELLAWVRLPMLTTADQTIFLYYGKAGAAEQQDPAMAWPARYVDVLHLDESGVAKLPDVSGHGNTGVPTNNPMLGVAGAIGDAVRLDGVDDYLFVQQSASLMSTTGDATFSLWINWDSLTSSHFQRVLASSNRFGGVPEDGYEWSTQPQGPFYLYPWGGAEDYNLGDNPFTAGTWQYLVATLDFNTRDVRIFVDGEPMVFTSENAPTLWTSLGAPGDWLWGSNSSLSGPFAGMMDEIEVSRGVRAPAWVRTSFANQKTDSTMIDIGAEQQLPP